MKNLSEPDVSASRTVPRIESVKPFLSSDTASTDFYT